MPVFARLSDMCSIVNGCTGNPVAATPLPASQNILRLAQPALSLSLQRAGLHLVRRDILDRDYVLALLTDTARQCLACFALLFQWLRAGHRDTVAEDTAGSFRRAVDRSGSLFQAETA